MAPAKLFARTKLVKPARMAKMPRKERKSIFSNERKVASAKRRVGAAGFALRWGDEERGLEGCLRHLFCYIVFEQEQPRH